MSNRARKRELKKLMDKATRQAYNETSYCLTLDCENTEISSCHLISKSNQLNLIAENNQLLWINLTPGQILFSSKQSLWKRASTSQILTFKGFCSFCDNSLFQEIDKPLILNRNVIHLLNYRAFSYFNWWTNVDITRDKKFADYTNDDLSYLDPISIPKSNRIRNRRDEHEYFELTHRVIAESLRDLVDGKSGPTFNSTAIVLTDRIDYVYSGALPLTTGWLGNSMGLDWRTSVEVPRWYVHLLNYENTSILIFSWDDKFSKLVLPRIEIFKEFDASERGRVFFQYVFMHSRSLACNSSVVESAKKTGLNEINQLLFSSQRQVGSPGVPIPSSNFDVPHLDIKSSIEL